MKINYLDLFSGIGGFALGIQQAGIRFDKHYFSEIDKYATQIYKRHFPDAVELGDIKGIRTETLGKIDLITGGFPCQPFSNAGKRRSKEDDRYLWPEMFRVIKECKPRWIVGENVAGIINLALHQALSDLETEGYEIYPFVVPACAVNAPHRRDRVWIIAHSKSNSDERKRIIAYSPNNGCNRDDKEGSLEKKFSKNKKQSGDRRTGGSERYNCNAPNTESGKPRESSEQKGRENIGRGNNKTSTDTKRSGEQGQYDGQREVEFWGSGARANWLEVASCLCRVDDGLPVRMDGLELSKARHRVERLKSLGNSVVVPLVTEIFKMIKVVEDGETK